MDDEPFDQAEFDAWCAADPRHREMFDTMWRHVMGPDMDVALKAYDRQRRSTNRALAGVSAGLIALLGGYHALPTIELYLAEPHIYAAADGAIRKVELADGTHLTLAGGADVQVRYTRHVRDVELVRGTIFADVAHDPDRPFHVGAGDGRVTVLGTAFELSKKPSVVRVRVESGHVQFGRNGWFSTPIHLVAEEGATLTAENLDKLRNTRGIARWRSEWVEYHEAPLREVVADLESISPLPIRISDDLASKRVSGRIRLTDPVQQLENLSFIHDFQVQNRKDYIFVSYFNYHKG